jgi:hypothetical protein
LDFEPALGHHILIIIFLALYPSPAPALFTPLRCVKRSSAYAGRAAQKIKIPIQTKFFKNLN